MTEQFLKEASHIARSAGELIMEMQAQDRKVSYKSARDMVTEVDQACENLIVSALQERFPDHNILAEEGGDHENRESDYQWIIDPLDGTTNFVHGFPAYCVSIGLHYQNQALLGVIYDPLRDEIFTASRGNGAFLNNKPIEVSKTDSLDRSLLATGFPYANDETFDLNMQLWVKIYGQTQGLRRAGAAALDLAWTACGRLDGFWEMELKPWDMAAGVLLVTEAGGSVSSPTQDQFSIFAGNVVATNAKLHTILKTEIKTIISSA